MLLIASKDFAVPQGTNLAIKDLADYPEKGKTLKQSHITIDDVPQKTHFHKGAIFAVGEGEFRTLSVSDRTLVSQLMVSKSTLEATPDNIKKVNADVAFDKKRAERDAGRSDDSPFGRLAEAIVGLQDLINARLPAPKA